MSQRMRQPREVGKAKEMNASLEPVEASIVLPFYLHSDFSHVRSIWDSSLSNRKINVCCF